MFESQKNQYFLILILAMGMVSLILFDFYFDSITDGEAINLFNTLDYSSDMSYVWGNISIYPGKIAIIDLWMETREDYAKKCSFERYVFRNDLEQYLLDSISGGGKCLKPFEYMEFDKNLEKIIITNISFEPSNEFIKSNVFSPENIETHTFHWEAIGFLDDNDNCITFSFRERIAGNLTFSMPKLRITNESVLGISGPNMVMQTSLVRLNGSRDKLLVSFDNEEYEYGSPKVTFCWLDL